MNSGHALLIFVPGYTRQNVSPLRLLPAELLSYNTGSRAFKTTTSMPWPQCRFCCLMAVLELSGHLPNAAMTWRIWLSTGTGGFARTPWRDHSWQPSTWKTILFSSCNDPMIFSLSKGSPGTLLKRKPSGRQNFVQVIYLDISWPAPWCHWYDYHSVLIDKLHPRTGHARSETIVLFMICFKLSRTHERSSGCRSVGESPW